MPREKRAVSSHGRGRESDSKRRRIRTPSPQCSQLREARRDSEPQESDRIERLENLVERLIRSHHSAGTAKNSNNSAVENTAGVKYVAREICIPKFCPETSKFSAKKWLYKIEQLAEMHDWDDRSKIYHMQARLDGLARSWYDNLTDYNHSWHTWKRLLKRAFPTHVDFASLLTDMMSRTKLPEETMASYYFSKMELLHLCEIKGVKAVSCIIAGLRDKSIQNNARAGRYETPEKLYQEFLSTIEEDKHPEQERTSGRSRVHQAPKPSTSNSTTYREHRKTSDTSKLKCYNCLQRGHYSRKCPMPRRECGICKRLGHESQNCFKKKAALTVSSETGTYDKLYFVDCAVNGKKMKGYLDSGSGAVTIRKIDAEILEIDPQPSSAVIRGYAGGSVRVLGEADVFLEVHEVTVKVKVFIVPDEAQAIPVLIGQPLINHPDVMMTIGKGAVRVYNKTDVVLPQVIDETTRKLPLWATEATVIPAKTIGYVNVTTHDDYDGPVYVEATRRIWEGTSYYVGRCVMQPAEDGLIIANTSDFPLNVKEKQIIVRADECKEEPVDESLVSAPVFNVAEVQYEAITIKDLNIGEHVPKNIKDQLLQLIQKHRRCFSQNLQELGKTHLCEMTINLANEAPVVYRPYRLSLSEKEIVRGIINELKTNNIIRDSDSPFASPILIVKKKTGENRLCVDYRALNKQTIKDKYPMPLIEDQLDKLSGNKLFTSLDMASGYYQIPMADDSIAKTAFVTPEGQFEYLRMPFGLVNAPAVFQRLINKIVESLRPLTVLAYLDDILIPSKNYEEGIESLRTVLEVLEKAGLTLRLQTCYFFQTRLDYLGYEITGEGIKPGANKTAAIQNYPQPNTVREIRQFLGLASYFRKFIKGFATIARPLTMLTRQSADFIWTEKQTDAFQTIKRLLTERPLLALYDGNAETEVHTDASKLGFGGILMQRQTNGFLQPVAYFSRQTTKHEERYHSYELETLAVVATLRRFRVYLLGRPFKVVTDCNALRMTFVKRDLVPRIGRWWLAVQEYQFVVEYRAGSKMMHVDALSRNPEKEHIDFSSIDLLKVNICEDDWVLAAQLQDERIKYLHEVLSKKASDREEIGIHNQYELKHNRVFRKTASGTKWVVPKAARRQLVMIYHDGIGHFSVDKTVSALSQNYWFPSMKQYVKRYVASCLGCLYNKQPAGRQTGYLNPIEKVTEPMHTVHLDHLGPFVKSKRKNSYLIVGVDAFTKYVFMRPVRDTTSKHVENFLSSDIISIFGVPKRLITDRGTAFTSKRFVSFCQNYNIKLVHNATATPRANGQVERYNRTILAALAATSVDDDDWDNVVVKVQWGLNTTRNKTTGESPFYMLFGYVPRSIHDSFLLSDVDAESERERANVAQVRQLAGERLQLMQEKEKSRYDKRRSKPKSFTVGDLVLLRRERPTNDGNSRKLLPKYDGPFSITKILDHDRYVVQDMKGSVRARKTYIGIYPSDKLKFFRVGSSGTDGSDTEEEVSVDAQQQSTKQKNF